MGTIVDQAPGFIAGFIAGLLANAVFFVVQRRGSATATQRLIDVLAGLFSRQSDGLISALTVAGVIARDMEERAHQVV